MKKSHLKKYVLLLAVCYLPYALFSQNCELRLHGHIRDADNSEGLGFSLVSMLNPSITIQADENGAFVFDDLCAGRYSLLIRHAGCRDTIFVIDLKKSIRVTFKLPHHLNVLNDIEIIAKHEGPGPTQSAAMLEGRSMDKTRGENLADHLKQLNGITTFNTGPTVAKPMINGMQGYRILILNNGIRQEGQQWGNEHAPEIDPFIAQRMTVIRGASAVRYGSDAIGGVILVEPGSMPDTAAITGEYNFAGSTNGRGMVNSLKLEGYLDRLKHFSWRVHGTLKKSGNLKTPEYYLSNTGTGETNFSYALSYHQEKMGMSVYYSQFNSRVGIYSGAHIGNLSDLYAAFSRAKPLDSTAAFSYQINRPFQNIEHELVKISGDIHTGKRSRVHANFAYQYNIRQEYDKHLPRNNVLAALNQPEADYRLSTRIAELYWEHDYIKSWRGQFGMQGMSQENQYKYRFFIPNYVNRTAGLFATERFIRAKYEIEGGARYDLKRLQSYFYEDGVLVKPDRYFNNLSLNVGAIYKPKSHLKFNLNIANGWRSPAPNELYSNGLHHGVGAIERGDKNLEKEECLSVISSGILSYEKLRVELTGYSYLFKNYIYYIPGNTPELTIRGAFPTFHYTQDNATINGADLLLTYKITKHLGLKARAMTVHGRNKRTQEPLIYMPADRLELSCLLEINDRKLINDIYFEPAIQAVSKQRRVPENTDFAPPPDAYWVAGFHLGATIRIKSQPIVMTISATNITNNIYRDYLDRFRYYADAPGANYVLRLRVPLVFYDKH